MNREKIAIDIVLLPDEKTEKISREINKECNWEIDFENSWKVPHMSLLMWLIYKDQLQILCDWIEKLPQINYAWESRLDNYFSESLWKYIPCISISKNEALKNIFSLLQTKIKPLLNYEWINKEMYIDSDLVNTRSLEWLLSFQNMTFDEYSGHITLWISDTEIYKKNTGTVWLERLAVFQLWNYNTCTNKLFEKGNEN